jgi:hypothetical protein
MVKQIFPMNGFLWWTDFLHERILMLNGFYPWMDSYGERIFPWMDSYYEQKILPWAVLVVEQVVNYDNKVLLLTEKTCHEWVFSWTDSISWTDSLWWMDSYIERIFHERILMVNGILHERILITNKKSCHEWFSLLNKSWPNFFHERILYHERILMMNEYFCINIFLCWTDFSMNRFLWWMDLSMNRLL